MKTLYLDLETYCEVPIQNGTYAYAEQAEILLFIYAVDDAPAKVWDCTSETITEHPNLCEALEEDEIEYVAHNSMFDRTVLRLATNSTPAMRRIGEARYRWRDTMVKALAHSLPGALGALCEVFKLPQDTAKDKDGRQLIHLFCKPLPANRKLRRATRETHPQEWHKFKNYGRLDVEAMRVVDRKIPNWNYNVQELDLWRLDQKINDRGVCVDTELANAAIRAVNTKKKQLSDRTRELTDGAVQAATQRDAMLQHLLAVHSVELPNLQKSTLERCINDEDLPAALRELLSIRLQASTSSTSKYKTLIKSVSSDNRIRGTLQFCGASRTG